MPGEGGTRPLAGRLVELLLIPEAGLGLGKFHVLLERGDKALGPDREDQIAVLVKIAAALAGPVIVQKFQK